MIGRREVILYLKGDFIMTFAIIAAEGIYEGLHGIETKTIVEASNWNEIYDIARELSLEVMESYGDVIEELEREVQEEIDFNDTVNWTEERIEELRAEVYNDNVYYNVYQLDEEKIKDDSYEQLEEEFYNDPEEFLEKYAIH